MFVALCESAVHEGRKFVFKSSQEITEEDKKEQEYLNNRTKNLTPVKSYQDMSDEELEYILNNIKGSTKEQEEKIRNAARVSEILRNTDYLSDIIKKQKQ